MDSESNVHNKGPDKFAIILGSAKSGTTSLYEYLVRHPEICECKLKEPHRFGNYLENGIESYKSLWEWRPTLHSWAMEASTAYTLDPRTPNFNPYTSNFPAELEKTGGKFKFLYIVRDPIDRARSHLAQYLKQGKEIQYSNPSELDWLVETSRYGKQIEPWVDRFGRDRIRVVSFDRLQKCPKKLLKEISNFFGVSQSTPPPKQKHNVTKGRLNTDIWNNMRSINFIRKTYRNIVPKKIRSEVKKIFNPRIYEGMQIKEREWKKYLESVREDVKRMEEFGIDTSGWGIYSV